MHHPYYKKIDRSAFEWGVIIPKEYEDDFLAGQNIKPGTSCDVTIFFEKKRYLVKLRNIKRSNLRNVYQLNWSANKDLLNKLRKTFIQSYVILKGQKEFFDVNKHGRKFFRSKLKGKELEVLCIKPISFSKIELSVFIKIEDAWNPLFERLADANAFGWIFEKDKKYLISRSTNWYSYTELPKHSGQVNVIYYLANTKSKLLYIGKAENFGNRVKHGRDHQGMSGDWDMFRYDIIRPEFSNILERIEDHTIRSFASVLKNTQSFSSLEISSYKLVNKNWKKL